MIELNEKDITNNFNLISTYKMLGERKIVNLYDWQKIIISFVRWITDSMNRNIVV